ncbi:MAG: hypothetical protein EXR45_05185 [Chloroflexi bacterium]|nr:hypothetical protein [Chloroflexota bacterium]
MTLEALRAIWTPSFLSFVGPIVAAALGALFGRAGRFGRGVTALIVLCGLSAGAYGAWQAPVSSLTAMSSVSGSLPAIGRLQILVISVGGALISIYHVLTRRQGEVAVIASLVVAATSASAFAGDSLRVAGAGVHLAVLLVAMLMATERDDWQGRVAGTAYLTMASIGAITLVAGFALADVQKVSPGGLVTDAFVVAVLSTGFALSIGIVPLYFWVPSASQRPGAGASMLALAVVVPSSLGLMLATLTALPQLSGPITSSHLLTIGGLLTAICGAVGTLAPGRLRRRIGYALMGNLGAVLLGFGTSTRIGVAGALVALAHHCLVAIVLMGAATEIETPPTSSDQALGDDDEAERDRRLDLRPISIAREQGWVARVAFVLGAIAMSGVPPFGGFASRWAVMQALVLSDWRLAFALGIASLVTTYALLVSVPARRMVVGSRQISGAAERFLFVLSVAACLWGFLPGNILDVAHSATSQLTFLKPF